MIKFLLIFACTSLAFGQAQPPKPPQEQPEFYDQPTFIVSGVADYAYRGGHGSDVILRSTEALTAAAASLKSQSNSSETPAARLRALADADEKHGNSLEAVHQYQRAAELDSSESNLFDWGLELLKHRAPEPAIEVFTKGNRLFPGSVRMLLGLAVAFYMRGDYEHAAQRFYEASDLNPEDPTPYMFLGRVQTAAITNSHEYLRRFARFATLVPNDAWANYYYAACLWRQRTNAEDSALTNQVRQLLNTAIRLDTNLAPGYLLLGILYSEQKDLLNAISAFRKAIEVSPDMEEAHYRLSQDYELSGDKAKAHQELELYKELSNNAAQKAKQEREQLQQFVLTLHDGNPNH